MQKFIINDYILENDLKGDLVPAIRRFLDENKSGDWSLELSKEAEMLYTDFGKDKLIYFSNNDGGLVRPSFNLENLKNVEIDGKGAKLTVRGGSHGGRGEIDLFYAPIVPFVIDNCENVVLKNFSIDWKTPYLINAKVLESKPGEMLIRPLTEQKYWCWNGHMYLEGEGWTLPIQRLLEVLPETGEIAENTGDNFGNGFETNWTYEGLEDGTVKVTGPCEKMPKEGNLLIMWVSGFNVGGRRSPGIVINKSKNVRLENVTINYALGMGVICQRSENIELDNVVVEPSGERRFSLSADAVHFVSCKGKISIENCRFQNQLDDCINIHGNFLQVLRQTGTKKLLARCGHAQHLGVELIAEGDVIELLDKDTLEILDSFTVTELDRINSELCEISFDKEINAPVKMYDVLENASWYAKVSIKNCVLRWNRARGMLLNGREEIVVDGCYFENPGSAICIETSPDWCESGPVKDVKIRNCRFVNCAHTSMWGNAVIRADQNFAKPELRATPLHGRIELENNSFEKINGEKVRLEDFEEVVNKK